MSPVAGGNGTGTRAAPTPLSRVVSGGAPARALPVRSKSTVLHELKSPLTAIMGFSDTLARQVAAGTAPPERLADRLGRIRAAAERIDELLDELRDLPD